MRALLLTAAIAVTSCTPAGVAPPTPNGAESPTPTGSFVATSAPPGTASPLSTDPRLAPPPVELDSQVVPVAPAGWHPWPVTAYLRARVDDTTASRIARPVGDASGRPVELVRLSHVRDWSVRGDGAIVASLVAGTSSLRLAIWEPSTRSARWLTPNEAGSLPQDVVWSLDGESVYYAVAPDTCTAPCFSIWEIRADGSGRRRIYGPSEQFGSPLFVTPDGKGLVWSRGQAGGSADVLDIATGVNRAFPGGGGSTDSAGWRTARPRALVLTGTCCAGIPRGEVNLWDDIGGSVSQIVGPRLFDPLGAATAVWDPDGRRVAVTSIEPLPGGDFRTSIVLTDESGKARMPVPNSDGLWVQSWIRAGIIAVRTLPRSSTSELLLVSPETGAATLLYTLRDASLVQVIGK